MSLIESGVVPTGTPSSSTRAPFGTDAIRNIVGAAAGVSGVGAGGGSLLPAEAASPAGLASVSPGGLASPGDVAGLSATGLVSLSITPLGAGARGPGFRLARGSGPGLAMAGSGFRCAGGFGSVLGVGGAI